MEWIDEQIEYWQKIAFQQEKYPAGLSMIEMIKPYVEINNLLQYKIQILMNKQ
jgi:hypothetical protein